MENLYLIVGLGNPGKEYEHTRHNVGFDCIDKFADSLGLDISMSGFQSLYVRGKYFENKIILLKPQTYMNNSGYAVQQIAAYFKIPLENILVIHDDMDFAPGVIKIKEGGSSAGHNGIKSIIQCLGSDKFKRIRIGIGKCQNGIIDYVLSRPSKDDSELINHAIDNSVCAIKTYLKESFNKAMSIYNQKL
ncbi:MAG: aminoacyl-tRNA hydrolase [Candidatus Onthovivens sp.]|nr:aminoacyl-tRNA hydrolase [Candidatus Onthovivens sp.]